MLNSLLATVGSNAAAASKQAHCAWRAVILRHIPLYRGRECSCMVWYGMVEVCEGAPVAVSGWVLTDT